MMYKRILILMLFFSCSQADEKSKSNLLSESEMIEVLVEINLLESAYKLNFLQEPKKDSTILLDYYHALFASKRYSFEEFQNSFNSYSQQPKKMQELLDSSLKRVQILEIE